MEKCKAFNNKDHNICLVPLDFMWNKTTKLFIRRTWKGHLAQEIEVTASLLRIKQGFSHEFQHKMYLTFTQGAYFADAFSGIETAFRVMTVTFMLMVTEDSSCKEKASC